MQLLNNEKERNWKQEKNKKSATKSHCFPPNPRTGYSCLQELGPDLFIMTLCHFSFSKSDVISERHKENRNTVSDWRKWDNRQLNWASENLQLVKEVTERSQDVCLHCEQLLNGLWQKVKSKHSNIYIKFYCPSPSDLLPSPQLPTCSPSSQATILDNNGYCSFNTAHVENFSMQEKLNASLFVQKGHFQWGEIP